MHDYIGDFVTIMPGDELFVTTSIHEIGDDGKRSIACGEWKPVPNLWYGWTRHYFEMRLEDLGSPGTIFIRRKSY